MSLAHKYMMKRRMAKGGHVKGVHRSVSDDHPGKSEAGVHAGRVKDPANMWEPDEHKAIAKDAHHEVLKEMHSMRGQDRKYLAEGGDVAMCAHGSTSCEMCHGGKMMAEGGDARDYHTYEPGSEENTGASSKTFHNKLKPAGEENVIDNSLDTAKSFVKKLFNSEEEKAEGGMMGYAEGGEVDDDLVSSIVRKRRGHSAGAKANETGPISDFEDNQFDYLVSNDDMGGKADYTGANSGDEIGNHQEDEDRKDVVSQIMASRRKKDRLPRIR